MAKFLKSDNRIVDIYLEFKVGCIEYKYTTHLKSDSSEFGVMETQRQRQCEDKHYSHQSISDESCSLMNLITGLEI